MTSEDSSTVKVFPASILTLSCVFNGVPTPSILWIYNNSTSLGSGVVTNGNMSELTVPPGSTEERGGEYMCMANNSLGNDLLAYHVQSESFYRYYTFLHNYNATMSSIVLPESVSGLTISSRTESSLSLDWTYQSDRSSPRTGVEIEVIGRVEC